MDFGRLPDISHVDFSLPPDDPANAAVLHTFGTGGNAVYTGCPVWGEKEWVGMIYPPGTASKDHLRHYARQFNSIELNTTYYRIPTPQTVAAWKAAASSGFRFCPKIPQEISHTRQLLGCEALTEGFCEVMAGLGEQLGPVFLQLPPFFGPGQAAALEAFVKNFPAGFRLCVEFRNEDWFRNRQELHRVFALFEERGTGTVITDTAGRRDVLHMRLTNATAFVRFTANDLHPTDYPRIEAWVKRLRQWQELGLDELYFFVHSPHHAQMPYLVNYAVEQFNAVCGSGLKPCVFVQKQAPDLFGF